ncbi:SDR family oxidoreductase [soil metagenome]
MRTTGRTILITGGAGGIGIEMAKKFIAHGNTVIACGRSEERLAAAREQLPRLVTFVCDITDLESVEQLAIFLEAEHPELDTVINNAAVTHLLDFHDAGVPEAIQSDVDTNIMGVVNVSWRLLPLLERNEDPCLAVMTSGIAYAPAHDVPGYSLTKAAMNSLCRSLRYALRDSVRVVEIVPPAVETSMTAGLECKKMAPSKVADIVFKGFEKNKPEIRMGETHVSHILNRIWPNGAQRLIRASFD